MPGAGVAGEHRRGVAGRILTRVRSYRDLEPELLGRVEELIDFVTVGEGA